MEDSDRFIDNLSDRLDHWLFVVIFFAGVLPAFIVRFFFGLPAYVTMIWLVAVMLVYFWLIINTRRFRLREDKAADNLYFLGFLFTVSALIISLLKFSQNTGTETQIANNPLVVVEDLGIGLITTLFGLLLRVFVSQLRRDPEEIEEEVRISLADAADRVQGDITATAEMIESARLLSAQVLEESLETLKAQQRLSKHGMERFRKVFETGSEKFIASTEGLREKIDAIDIRKEIFTEKLDQPIEELESTIQGFSTRIQQLEIPSDLLSSQTEEAIVAVRAAVTSTIAREMVVLREEVSAGLSTSISQLEEEMAVLIGNIEVPPELLTDQLEPITESLKAVFEQFESETAPLFTNFTTAVEANLTQLQEFQVAQTAQLGELTRTAETARENLGDVSKGVKEKVNEELDQIAVVFEEKAFELGSENVARFEQMSERQTEQLSRLQNAVDLIVESTERYRGQMGSVIESGGENFARFEEISARQVEQLSLIEAAVDSVIEATERFQTQMIPEIEPTNRTEGQ